MGHELYMGHYQPTIHRKSINIYIIILYIRFESNYFEFRSNYFEYNLYVYIYIRMCVYIYIYIHMHASNHLSWIIRARRRQENQEDRRTMQGQGRWNTGFGSGQLCISGALFDPISAGFHDPKVRGDNWSWRLIFGKVTDRYPQFLENTRGQATDICSMLNDLCKARFRGKGSRYFEHNNREARRKKGLVIIHTLMSPSKKM